jgi:hypothetical protein
MGDTAGLPSTSLPRYSAVKLEVASKCDDI